MRPPTAQVHLQLHMSGDFVHTTIVPVAVGGGAAGASPFGSRRPSMVGAPAAGFQSMGVSGQFGSSVGRPATPQVIHLSLNIQNGVVQAQLLPASNAAAGAVMGSRPATGSGQTAAAVSEPGERVLSRQPTPVTHDMASELQGGAVSEVRPGTAHVELLLDLYGDQPQVASAHTVPLRSSASGRGPPVPGSAVTAVASQPAVTADRPPTAQVALVLEISGDMLHASLLPKRGSLSGAARPPTAQLQLLLEVNGSEVGLARSSSMGRSPSVLGRSSSMGGAAGVALAHGSSSRPGTQQGSVNGSRPGTALVQLTLDISGEELHAHLAPLKRASLTGSVSGRSSQTGAGSSLHALHSQHYRQSHADMTVVTEEGEEGEEGEGGLARQASKPDIAVFNDDGDLIGGTHAEVQQLASRASTASYAPATDGGPVAGNLVHLRLTFDEGGNVQASIVGAGAGYVSRGSAAGPAEDLEGMPDPLMDSLLGTSTPTPSAYATISPSGLGWAAGGQTNGPGADADMAGFGGDFSLGRGGLPLAPAALLESTFGPFGSRPATAQVHLQLHLSGDVLRADIVPVNRRPTPPTRGASSHGVPAAHDADTGVLAASPQLGSPSIHDDGAESAGAAADGLVEGAGEAGVEPLEADEEAPEETGEEDASVAAGMWGGVAEGGTADGEEGDDGAQ